jgi:23S rRNA (uracil1939-C5)-methyltransferase
MAIIQVHIRNIAFGGDGVGEVFSQEEGDDLLGITAFVPFTAVGEKVVARVLEKKDRYVKAEMVAILEPSASREPPPCPVFMQCGGCELQHMHYPEEVRIKEALLKNQLLSQRVSKDVLETIQPLIESRPYSYRRRIALHLDQHGTVGLYRSQTRSIVPLSKCYIVEDQINEVLKNFAEKGHLFAPSIRTIHLESDEQGVIALLRSSSSLSKQKLEQIVNAAKECCENVVISDGEKEIGGFGRRLLELPLNRTQTLKLLVPSGSFSQGNWEMNLELIEWVKTRSLVKRGTKILDLYSGAGNFSLPLAREGAEVVAVEVEEQLVSCGKEAVRRAKLDAQIRFSQSTVETYLDANSNKTPPDLLLLDPPRNGLGRVVGMLPKSKRVILISCVLPSFIRDLKLLLDRGYKVTEIQPFDMFPQTTYMEIGAVLEI